MLNSCRCTRQANDHLPLCKHSPVQCTHAAAGQQRDPGFVLLRWWAYVTFFWCGTLTFLVVNWPKRSMEGTGNKEPGKKRLEPCTFGVGHQGSTLTSLTTNDQTSYPTTFL